MKRNHTLTLISILAAGLSLIPSSILLRTRASVVKALPQAGGDVRGFLGRAVTAHAAGRGNPWVTLRDGSGAPVEYSGSSKLVQQLSDNKTRPLSIGLADFDEDGVPDIVAGYAGTKDGVISVQRGDADTIFPNTREAIAHRAQLRASTTLPPAQDEIPSPFFVESRVFDVAGAPQFLCTGDFDGDGHRDVVTAEAGSGALLLLSGDGHGGFAPARSIALAGKVTALVAGDVNRIDGLADLMVAVKGTGAPRLLIYEGGSGALKAAPEVITLPAESKSIAFGQLDADYPVDIAVAAERDLLIVHGRDRKHSTVEGKKLDAQPPVVTRIAVSFSIASVSIGDFTGDLRQEIALLSDDGTCHVFSRTSSNQASWQEVSAVALPIQKDQQTASVRSLVSVRLSSSPKDDLLMLDQGSRQLQIMINESASSLDEHAAKGSASSNLRVAGAIDFDSEAVAVLGMRLNEDALSDLVVLKSNATAPTVIMTTPASTFSVTNTNDSGAGSLRTAISSANSNPGADSISFAIPGSGTQTITPLSPLPVITGPVTIDGTTQNLGSATPPIELDGSSAGPGVKALSVSGGNSIVRGLVINRFQSLGIELFGSGCNIEGNFIGTNATGTAGQGNGDSGVLINAGSGHVIGGTVAAARNVISANVGSGVQVLLGPSTNHQVQGNLIGTDVTGMFGLGNTSDGVEMLSITGSNVANCTVGGTTAGAANVISANLGVGVQFITVGTSNLVQGNLIGTDATGSSDLGNGSSGVAINEANDCTVGGTVAGAGNLISGNGSNGVRINAPTATSNRVQGNRIGTRADGVTQLQNSSSGVLILNSASNNSIGGAAGAGNVIAFNQGAGVMVNSGTGNAIQSNSIFSNVGLGIDLGPSGVTPNDGGDGDAGANNLQNFPVLTSANGAAGGGVNIQGTLNSNANTTFTLEFFSNPACDASGNGEGRTFLGSGSATTNGAGNAAFNVTLASSATSGESITATATSVAGDTSEFSACFSYGAADLGVAKSVSSGIIVVGSNVTYTITLVNNGPDSAISITVTDNLPASLAFVSCSSTGGGVCGGSGNNRIVSFSSLESGGSAVITIVANLDCAVSNGQSIANTASVTSVLPDPVSGNNSSSVSFTASNPPRVISPTSASFALDGGDGIVDVTAPAGCGWQSVSNDAWIVITSGSSGTGNGSVGYNVAVNATGSPRTGTLTVAGLTFTVNQSNVSCSYALMPTSSSFTASGGSGSVSVTTSTGCRWKAISNDDWLVVVPGVIGIGSGSFNYTVNANPANTPRTGTISVEGQTFTVMQAGVPCMFSIEPTGELFPDAGAEASFAVTTSPACEWSVSTTDSWIFITSEGSVIGSGLVTYGVSDNFTGVPRQGAISVAGLTFNVVQDGGTLADCEYALNPTSATFNAPGGNGSVQVIAAERCAWEATVNVSWITLTSEIVGIGTKTVTYAVKSNPDMSGRGGIITIGGRAFRVKQKGK